MEETTSFWTYLAVLRKRLWIVLLLFAATMVVILAQAWRTPPRYASSTVLQVIPLEPEEVTLFSRQNAVSSADTIDLILFQFSNLVRSTRIAQRTVADTGVDMTAGELAAAVSVERDPAGDVVTISVTAGSPDDAEKLVARQVEYALEEFRNSRVRLTEAAGKFLDTELANAERELENARSALLRFKLDTGLEYLDREITAEQDAIRRLSAEQESANIERERLEAIVAELEKQLKDAQAKLAALPEGDASSADRAYWGGVSADLARLLAQHRLDIVGQRQKAAGSYALLAQHQTNLASLITLTGQSEQLQDAVIEKQASRDFLADKAREARLKQSQSRNIGYLQVISPPATPQSSVRTRTVQIALLGGLLSLVLGGLLVFVLEFVERTVRTAPRRSQGRL
jgi:uncharacterized protein involved in exopolysaccharide biosynthesis